MEDVMKGKDMAGWARCGLFMLATIAIYATLA